MPAMMLDTERPRAGDLQPGDAPVEQGVEHGGHLEAGQRRAEAEVGAESEGDVVVRDAADVERVGGRAELVLVGVGPRRP